MPSPHSRGNPSKIFISYRRSESAAHAGRLSDQLRSHFGTHVIFIDIESIEPGRDFVEAIEDAVSSCRILLAIIGRQWLTCANEHGRRLDDPKDFVRLELATALKRGLRVIPVLVQGAAMPREQDLPDEIAPLARKQAWEVSDLRWNQDVGNLIEKIAGDVPGGVRGRKRALLVVSICALLAALGLAGLRPWRGADKGGPVPDQRTSAWAYQRTLAGHKGTVYSNTFSPDGLTVAAGSYDGTVMLWDVQTGSSLRTLPMSDEYLVYTIAISRVGDHLAAGVGYDVMLGNVKTGAQTRALKGHTGRVFTVAFEPGGEMLVSGGQDHTIRVWDVRTGQTLRTLAGHADEVNALAFSADGKLLASGSYDGTVIIWEVATWAVKARLVGHVGHVYAVAFASDGRTLVSGGEDKTVRLWDVQSGALKQTPYQHPGVVNSVAFAPDDGTIASAGEDDVVRLWDARAGTLRQTLRRHTAAVNSVAFAPDGRTLASGSTDKTVILWGLQTGHAVPSAPRPDSH